MPHAGSAAATSLKALTAASRWNEWSSATARLKPGWTAGAQDVVNRTVPRRSAVRSCAGAGTALRATRPATRAAPTAALMASLHVGILRADAPSVPRDRARQPRVLPRGPPRPPDRRLGKAPEPGC